MRRREHANRHVSRTPADGLGGAQGLRRAGVLVLVLAFVLAACGGAEEAEETEEPDTTEEPAATEEPAVSEEPETSEEPAAEEEEPAATEEPEATGWQPEGDINFSIPFGPGGGGDQMARMVIEIMGELDVTDVNITGTNREGGSGARGWGYVADAAGDPHVVSLTSGSVYTTPLVADTGWTVEDFTSVAILGTDTNIFAVAPDAPWETLDEFMETAGNEGVSFTAGGVVGTHYMTVRDLLAQAGAGDNFDFVDLPSIGEQITAVTSGTVDALYQASVNIQEQVEGGTLRALAKEEGINGLPDVPTFDELGYEINVFQPRGVILPPDVPEEAREWWIDVFQQVVETDRWKEFEAELNLNPAYRWGDEATEFNADMHERFEATLREEGVID